MQLKCGIEPAFKLKNANSAVLHTSELSKCLKADWQMQDRPNDRMKLQIVFADEVNLFALKTLQEFSYVGFEHDLLFKFIITNNLVDMVVTSIFRLPSIKSVTSEISNNGFACKLAYMSRAETWNLSEAGIKEGSINVVTN
jgi:hypothetical protein